MAWARRQAAPATAQTQGTAPRGGGDEALFDEQDYGILSQRSVAAAVAANNSRALDDLPTILAAFHLAPRTAYDAEVVLRIAEFQQNFFRREDAGTVDGQVGARTRELLTSYYQTVDRGEVDATGLWPPQGASVEEQFEHYSRIAGLFGARVRQGQPLLIGLRGVMELAGATHEIQHVNAYDDTYVLLLQTDQGVGVRTFSGATHAYQATSGLSPDADGRNGGDVGSVRPTHDGESYTLRQRGDYHGRTSMGVASDPREWGADSVPSWWALGHVPAHRDTDHDRELSATEQRASETRTRGEQVQPGVGDWASVVWFHPGYTEQTDTGRPFASIGCLTAREEDVENLDAVAEAHGDIRMIVVEAQEAAARLAAQAQATPGAGNRRPAAR